MSKLDELMRDVGAPALNEAHVERIQFRTRDATSAGFPTAWVWIDAIVEDDSEVSDSLVVGAFAIAGKVKQLWIPKSEVAAIKKDRDQVRIDGNDFTIQAQTFETVSHWGVYCVRG
jgi:hypothetical protein